jgi:hypothetical protein
LHVSLKKIPNTFNNSDAVLPDFQNNLGKFWSVLQ